VARDAFFKTGFEAMGLPRIMAQYGVLRYIYFSEAQCLSQSQIMRLRGVSSANVTNLIHSLERAGLVRRGPTPENKRSTSVYLTQAGIAFCEKTVPMVGADIGRVGECFSDAELGILNELLARLHAHVEKLAAERRLEAGSGKRAEVKSAAG
jgi:DNA-binding MarR family transcriptional regulator